MAITGTTRDLLIVALQDLNDGERAVIQFLPSLAEGVSARLAGYIAAERERAARQSARLEQALEALGAEPTDAPNLWLRAELDDAARDHKTIEPGPLRDIALVGAFRKARQSERVSYETAVGLANAVGEMLLAADLEQSRDEEAQADAELAGMLQELLAQA